MENNFFRPAGDLSSSLESESKFFMPAGDLSEDKSDLIYSKTDKSDSMYGTSSVENKYFKPAGDLDDGLIQPIRESKNINNINVKKINNINENIDKVNINNSNKLDDYLLSVVSGKKYDRVCELGVLMGAGRMVVSVEQLMQMVDEGYNIVSANVINSNMIKIEFQRYEYDQEKMERWRRF